MSTDALTVLVPVDLIRRPVQLRRRTVALVRALAENRIRAVVVHNVRGSGDDQKLRLALQKLSSPWLRVLSQTLNEGLPNNALLRNRGHADVDTPYLMMLDADILASAGLVRALLYQAQTHPSGTAMAPCLYLSPMGTVRALLGSDHSQFWREYLAHDRRSCLHLAIPSSVMVLKTADFGAVGGFDEAYTGHGFEDFDFMVRLAQHTGAIDLKGVQEFSEAYRAPLLATGFRGVLANWCFDALVSGSIALHLHHSRDADEAYYQSRQENARRFQEGLKMLAPSIADAGVPKLPLALASAFYRHCSDRGINPDVFEPLLNARPSLFDRGGVLQRTLLRLASKPVQRVAEEGLLGQFRSRPGSKGSTLGSMIHSSSGST